MADKLHKEEIFKGVEGATALPPRRDRNIPSNSPFKNRLSTVGLVESMASDVSMDISDITLEIEKINRDREDPEKGMKDTNRLLKEIDQQMEQSFEIMEERQNMVRSFLKDREKAEVNHRHRANQLMKQFTDKMSVMESSLGVEKVYTKTNTTSVTQTDVIETNDEELQTSYVEINNDALQEAVEALTHDMKDVVQKQLLREKVAMLQELELRKNQIDEEEITKTLADLERQFRLDKAKSQLKQLIQNEAETSVKERLLSMANNLVEWLDTDDNDDVLNGLSDDLKIKLRNTKTAFQEINKSGVPNQESNFTSDMHDLRKACRKIDLLEASLDSVLADIQKNLDLSSSELKQLTTNILKEENEGERSQLIENLVSRSYTTESSDKEQVRKTIKDFVNIQNELHEAEEVCQDAISLKFTDSNDDFLKKQMLKIVYKNKTLVEEKEELLGMLNSGAGELVVNPTTNIYIEPIRMDEDEEESIEDLLAIEPKLGGTLVQDLLHVKENKQMRAIGLVHYNEKSLENIIQEYESEIKQLSEYQNEALAYEEVEKIISRQAVTSDTLAALKEEQEKVEERLRVNTPQIEEVNNKLEALKLSKEEMLRKEKKLLQRKNVLKRNLKELNKRVADNLMNEERKKEKVYTEEQIGRVAMEIEHVRSKIADNLDNEKTEKHKLQNLAEKSLKQERMPLSKKLSQLKEDLEKLCPFVNKHSVTFRPDGVSMETPNTTQVKQVIETRNELSKRLTETEHKIQEIITSNDYESSPSGSLEQIEDLENYQALDNRRKSHDLNTKLVEIEMELDNVNTEMKKGEITLQDLHGLKKYSEQLKNALNDIEMKLKPDTVDEKCSNKIKELQNEISSLRQQLEEKEIQNLESNLDEMETLESAKAKLERELQDNREEMVVGKDSEVAHQALRDLLEERERTKKLIMCLEDDERLLSDAKQKSSGHTSINKSLKCTDEEMLKQKSYGISTIIQIARNRLDVFIDIVKTKMEKKLQEAKEKSWVNKENLTKEEKQKLGKELKDILGDINQTKKQIKQIDEFELTGFATYEDQSLLTTLYQKKRELLSILDDINIGIQTESENDNNIEGLLKQKIKVKQELMDLDERIGGQDQVLKERLKKLQDLKHVLENKMADSVSIDDLQTIITQLDKKEQAIQSTKSGEPTVDSLIKERLSLSKNILSVPRDTEEGHEEAAEMCKVLESVDADIFERVEKVMSKLNMLDVEDDGMENFSFHLLANTAATFELQHAKNEFENALKLSGCQPSENQLSESDLKDTFMKIKETEDFRKILQNFISRNIDFGNIEDIKELKSLNEDKLGILLNKIKKLNLLIERKEDFYDHEKCSPSKEYEKLARDSKKIERELETAVTSYDVESQYNEHVVRTKPYINRTTAPVKLSALAMYLERRDEKLNELFFLEKELENANISEEKREDLNNKKDELEKIIEDIDEKIIDGDFPLPAEENNGSPTRSFSPRSTSSRNSFSVVIDERDKLLKKIFQLQKKEEHIRESEDILNKFEHIKEIEERKEKMKQHLQHIDRCMFRCNTSDDTLLDENDTIQNITRDDVQKSIELLSQQFKVEQFKPVSSSKDDVIDLNEFIIKPKEVDIFLQLQNIEERMLVKKMKDEILALQLEKEAIEITQSEEKRAVTEELLKTQKLLAETEAKLVLLQRKENLEDEMRMLKEKVDNNEKRREEEKEEISHERFVLTERVVAKSELKKSKIKLEQELDEINIIIHQYSNALEKEVNITEAEQENNDEEEEVQEEEIEEDMSRILDEHLNSLLSHKRELQQRFTNFTDSVIDENTETSLVDLLGKRRKVIKEIEEVQKLLHEEDIRTRKECLTEEIKVCYEEYKEIKANNGYNVHKKKLLHKKVKQLEQSEASLNKNMNESKYNEDFSRMKCQLGEDLFSLLQDPKVEANETHLKELMMCMEDRTISQYIKDMVGLCTLQTEQIQNLKNDIELAKEEQTEGKQTADDFYKQIEFSNNELTDVQEKLGVLETTQKQVRELVGIRLHNLITGNMDNDKTTDPWFNEVRKRLRNAETIEELLISDIDALERGEINANLIDQLVEDKTVLQKRLGEQEEQCELLRQREEDFFSETESLRDNLQQCTSKTSSIHEEAQKLKDDYEETKEKLEKAIAENDRLKARLAKKEKTANLTEGTSKIKTELMRSNKENENLKITKSQLQNELDSFRKKFKRLSREKSLMQEKLELETKHMKETQAELNASQQKERLSKTEMHKNCQLIEKQRRELNKMKETKTQVEKQNEELQHALDEVKEKYQTLNVKHQNETTKITKELRAAKNKVEVHKTEIEKLTIENEVSRNDELGQVKIAFANERTSYVNEIKDLTERLEEETKNNKEEAEEMWKKIKKIEKTNEELSVENKTLLDKLHDLDESFEAELLETRKELNEKYNQSVDKLNEKIRNLANDVITIEQLKNEVETEKDIVDKENEDLSIQLQEQATIMEEKEKTNRVKISSIQTELEGVKLENSELQDEISELRSRQRQLRNLENFERELKEKHENLQKSLEEFELEKNQFGESMKFFMTKSTNERDKNVDNKKQDDRVSFKLLKMSQDERDKMNEDLIASNRDLQQTRNELRKVKAALRQKEQDYFSEEKQLISNIEARNKQKLEELQKYHNKEKEKILKLYSEEQSKWEEEIRRLKDDLHEENLKKLGEQRQDYETEMKQQFESYMKAFEVEKEEMQEQIDISRNEKKELIKQFESDRMTMKKKYDNERYALEETIRRLLKNLMKYKDQRNKLKTSHQDEIIELEERFDAEKERLEERREEELQTLKENLYRLYGNNIKNERKIPHVTFDEIINESTSKKSGGGTLWCADKKVEETLTLKELKELVHMGDLSGIIDAEYDGEKEMIKQSMREQYKVRLRNETDSLMKRLLELSDELDSLRSNA